MNNFSNYLSPQDENILAVEISCHNESEIWKSSDKNIFSLCMQGIEKDNFLKKELTVLRHRTLRYVMEK